MAENRMKRGWLTLTFATFLAIVASSGIAAAEPAGNIDLPRYPSISPDGARITFSWRGDLWIAPTKGGQSTRLTTHPGHDLRSAWSGDGQRIAFTSTRDGHQNIYLMNADGTDIRRVTDTDRPCSMGGFAFDDDGREVITLSASVEGDIYREPRPYMISTDGGDLIRLHDAHGSTPVLSADGKRIAFSRGGTFDGWTRRHYLGAEAQDVWLYDRDADSFTQLTTHRGNDGVAKWGGPRTLLFLSDRELDCVNLYRMSATDGEATSVRITSFEVDDIHGYEVSADGSTAVLAVWDTLYRLDLNNPSAQPVPIELRAIQDENDNFILKSISRSVSDAALSPDGKVMAVIAYGEVYVRNIKDGSPSRRVTDNHARERGVAWSPDGLKLYFTSDRSGINGIYEATVALTRGEVKEAFEEATKKKKDADNEEEEAEEGDEPAAEESEDDAGGNEPDDATKDDPVTGIWAGAAEVPDEGPIEFELSLKLGKDGTVTGAMDAGPYSGPITGSYDRDSKMLELSVATSADDLTISMTLKVDGGKLTGSATADQTTVQIIADRTGDYSEPDTDDEKNGEREEGKKKDKKEKELPKELQPDRWHDAMTFNIASVVLRDTDSREASPSPDGKMLAFRGVRGDVFIMDIETGEIRNLITGWDAWVDWRWSPDSKYIAYAQTDMDFNGDIHIIPADGSAAPVNITRHPDNDRSPRFSADGKILSFLSERIEDEFDVWMVYLDKDLEALTSQELKEYYEEAGKAAKKRKPLKIEAPEDEEDEAEEEADGDEDAEEEGNGEDIDDEEDEDEAEEEEEQLDLEDAYLRVKRMTRIPGNEGSLEMTPAGDRLIFSARGESPGLYSIKWDGSDQKKITGSASVRHMSLTGDKVVLVSGSRAATAKPTGGSMDYIDVSDRIRIDLEKQSSQKFLEAARTLNEQYYHPTMKDLDWPALTEKYHALAKRARTGSEFKWVAERFIGELNGSHRGVYARDPSMPNRQSYGRLGTFHKRVADGFEVTRIIPESPANKGPMALKVGDVITAIEFEPFGPTDTIEAALKDRVGEETVVSIKRTMEDGEQIELDLLLSPSSYRSLSQLQYKAWRLENARLVNEWSDGRLGYIHIQGMSQSSLDVFERDLYAAAHGKDGLVLDVRNNGGGWTADRVLASIMVMPHSYTMPRGADPNAIGHYPKDRLFIQRYSMPMNLLCNEKSYSNAEIIAHAFKTLGRGTLVGQQTHGSVISTSGFGLIDGTFVRLPFRGWFVSDGKTEGVDMELNGAIPNLLVPQTPEAEVRGEDEQLRAAAEDLLKRLD